MAVIRKRTFTRDTWPTANGQHVSVSELYTLATANNLETDPINIKGLAKALGLKIKPRILAEETSGHLEKIDNEWVVTVNLLHHPRRQRFTLAHEIAHYILHRDRSDSFIDGKFFRSDEKNPMEREADSFAAELLMPEAEFRNFVKSESSTVEDIANHFEVSSLAVRIRAKNLGFKGHNV